MTSTLTLSLADIRLSSWFSGSFWLLLKRLFFVCLFLRFFLQEKSNKEIDLTYQLKVLQQELEQEEASHKTTRTLLADKSKIKVTIEGAKSESMKGEFLLVAPPPPQH